jgi:hypothetical protein
MPETENEVRLRGPFIYTKVESLKGTKKAFSGQCAELVQWYTYAGKANLWREGIKVKGNGHKIAKGTAIATFVNGKYPNKKSGNHAALYISQNASGIRVMDQWTSKPTVSSRVLSYKGKHPNGTYIDPSNNADAFSVIMVEAD